MVTKQCSICSHQAQSSQGYVHLQSYETKLLFKTYAYCTVLSEETMYLVGCEAKNVPQAHVPTLISEAIYWSGVWETLPNTPYYYSAPVTIGNTLLTVEGSEKPL